MMAMRKVSHTCRTVTSKSDEPKSLIVRVGDDLVTTTESENPPHLLVACYDLNWDLCCHIFQHINVYLEQLLLHRDTA